MATTVRHIIAPETMKLVDRVLEQREQQNELAKAEVRSNDALLKPDGAADVTDREVQKGRRFLRSEFIRRLRKHNPGLAYEQSKNYPDHGGIYFCGYRENPDTHVKEFGKWFICGLPHEVINEFSTVITVPEIIPDPSGTYSAQELKRVDQQEPGWRSILLRLLQNGLLTPAQIDKEFKITQGRSSEKWKSAVNPTISVS